MFHVGQMVVCVDAAPEGERLFKDFEIRPVKGCVYTIRALESVETDVICLLEEIVNPILLYEDGADEMLFRVSRFRPVRNTSIDVFTAILNKAPEKVEA